MKKNVWMIVAAIAAIAMLAVVFLSVFKGGCTGMLDCGDKQVPMKCHWAFIATRTIGLGGFVMAVAALIAKTKEGRIMASLGVAVASLCALVSVTNSGIGVCTKPEMICNATAPMVIGACVIALILALVMLIKADPEKAEQPKMQL